MDDSENRRSMSSGRGAMDMGDDDEAEVDPHLFENESSDGGAGVSQSVRIGDEEEEGEGEDLLQDDFLDDYRPMPHLDTYEVADIDDAVQDDRDSQQRAADRQAAEAAMARRDAALRGADGAGGRRRQLPTFLQDASVDDGADEEDGPAMRARRRRRRMEREAAEADGAAAAADDGYGDDDGGGDDGMDDDDMDDGDDDDDELLNVQGNLREWVSRDEVRRFVARRFRNFLHTFRSPKDENEIEYMTRIRDLVEMNSCSLPLDYGHLLHTNTVLAVWLADAPKQMLEVLDEVARSAVLRLFPKYSEVHDEIFVRVTDLPITDAIRDIRQTHLNCLIRMAGVVTRRTGVFPQLQQVRYDCVKCGALLGPFFQNSTSEIRVGSCPDCQSKGPFTVNVEQTLYRNYQKLTLQESPGTVPAGRLPRHKDVILLHDLIDCARPGEEIEVTGIYTNNFDAALNTRHGFPVFATVVESNSIRKRHDAFAADHLTDEDKDEILRLSKDPRIAERIVKSIAPSIYGHEDIKTALALAMFGGLEKHKEKMRLRGDINVLMLGDPGTAKSQFLKYVEKTAHRAVYTTGKGASAVGLTAAVHRDPVTREWTLEGGALVLADRGTCLIDEFDKMNEQDRVSIHEAMEQQTISISKAGIVTSLSARCSVIAAANPIGGRYDASKTFSQNVELTEPILSRFDILLVVKDMVDPVVDEKLALFVTNSHMKSHPNKAPGANDDDDDDDNDAADGVRGGRSGEADPDVIPQRLLRKYIAYARQAVFPRIHESEEDKIAHVYATLRRQSMDIPIAVRHVDAAVRMSEAHARMHLRQYVTEDDVNAAIRVLLHSFISTQKYGMQRQMEKTFSRFMAHQHDFHQLLLSLLRGLLRDALRYRSVAGAQQQQQQSVIEIRVDDLEAKAREYNIVDLQPFFTSSHFLDNHFELDNESRVIRHRVL